MNLLKLSASIAVFTMLPAMAYSATHVVDSVSSLRSKLSSVNSGDTIRIKPGTYAPSDSPNQNTLSYANGGKSLTASPMFKLVNKSNITIEAYSSSNKPILKGRGLGDGNYVFYAQKAHGLTLKNIKFTNSEKGVIIDRSDNVKILNNEIYWIGWEGLHIRDKSRSAQIRGNKIRQVGFGRIDRGEGVYMCNDKKYWHPAYQPGRSDYKLLRNCDGAKIENNTFGPDIGAEAIDLKEGVANTIIRDNIMKAKRSHSRLTNQSGDKPKSVVHDKGANSKIHDNHFDMSGTASWGSTNIGAVRVEQVLDVGDSYATFYGHGSKVVKNTVVNDNSAEYALDVPSRASLVQGCNTNANGNAVRIGSKSKSTVTNVSGTGCNAHDSR